MLICVLLMLRKKNINFFIICLITFNFYCKKDPFVNECIEYKNVITTDPEKRSNKVLIVGIDGVRSDVISCENSPFLYSFLNSSNSYSNLNHKTEIDTYSGPNWTSILTGVHYEKHNVLDNSFENNQLELYPNFFNYLESSMENHESYSLTNWVPLNQNVLKNDVDYANLEYYSDSLVFEFSKHIISEINTEHPSSIFIQFDELDGAGHKFGFSKEVNEYTQTLKQIDLYLNELYSLVEQRRSNGENWLVIFVSDHGGDGYSHADQNNPNINQTMLIIDHPYIYFNNEYLSKMTDIVPTIFNFMGITNSYFNCYTDGESIIL